MKISMIAAIGAKNELGEGDKLIWRIPDDTKRLLEKITGHPVIMGMKTAEQLINVYKIAYNYHDGQFREEPNTRYQRGSSQVPYIFHPLEAALHLV